MHPRTLVSADAVVVPDPCGMTAPSRKQYPFVGSSCVTSTVVLPCGTETVCCGPSMLR
jgi:hypothetical protein